MDLHRSLQSLHREAIPPRLMIGNRCFITTAAFTKNGWRGLQRTSFGFEGHFRNHRCRTVGFFKPCIAQSERKTFQNFKRPFPRTHGLRLLGILIEIRYALRDKA
jgi:hypothetical protein